MFGDKAVVFTGKTTLADYEFGGPRKTQIEHLARVRGVLRLVRADIQYGSTDSSTAEIRFKCWASGWTNPMPGWDADGRPVEEWPL